MEENLNTNLIINEVEENLDEVVDEAIEVIDNKTQFKFIGKAAIALGITTAVGCMLYHKVIKPRREKKMREKLQEQESLESEEFLNEEDEELEED